MSTATPWEIVLAQPTDGAVLWIVTLERPFAFPNSDLILHEGPWFALTADGAARKGERKLRRQIRVDDRVEAKLARARLR